MSKSLNKELSLSFSVWRELRIHLKFVKDSGLDHKCYAGSSFDTNLEN